MIRIVFGWMSIAFVPLAVSGQSMPVRAFEVASINVAARSTTRGARASVTGDRVVYSNTTLKNVLARAFGMKSGNQIGGSSWILLGRYDIIAKAPDNTPKEQIPLMLQTLLAESFRLKLHHEQRALPAYALVSGKGRLKLQKVEDGSAEKNSFVDNNGHREAKNLSMAGLAQTLSLMLEVPVLDMTGRKDTTISLWTIPWKSVAG